MKYETGRTLREQDTDASDVDALTLASPGMSIKRYFTMFKVTALHLISITRLVHQLCYQTYQYQPWASIHSQPICLLDIVLPPFVFTSSEDCDM